MDSDAIIGAVTGVTKKWSKQRKAEERRNGAEANRRARLISTYRITIKDVAFRCMEEAYLKASGGGRLPAHARQIMYQARPIIQVATGEQLSDQYFCQTLLPDYLNEYQPGWDVVFDDRGHFHEPHTETTIGLGTLSVRKYLSGIGGPIFTEPRIAVPKIETHGPIHRYGAVLFIEKEGFMPLFEKVQLAEKYDIAIMSTKGMSNTAARRLVDEICGPHDIPLLVLHDFDKAGFSILGTLSRSTRRYNFRNHVNVIDLGLRLADVQELDLEPEAAFDKGRRWSKKQNLMKNGANPEEVDFLLDQRVELNALTSDELVGWIEGKLEQNGIVKLVPDEDTLSDAYCRAVEFQLVRKNVEAIVKVARDDASKFEVPLDIEARVQNLLDDDPTIPWDQAVAEIASEIDGGEGDVQ